MPYPAGVKPWKIKEFTNVHQNFTQPLDEDQSFDMFLDDPAFQNLDQLSQYNKCTENFQWIIQHCLEKQLNYVWFDKPKCVVLQHIQQYKDNHYPLLFFF